MYKNTCSVTSLLSIVHIKIKDNCAFPESANTQGRLEIKNIAKNSVNRKTKNQTN